MTATASEMAEMERDMAYFRKIIRRLGRKLTRRPLPGTSFDMDIETAQRLVAAWNATDTSGEW